MRYNERVQAYNTHAVVPVERHRRIFGFKEHPLFNAPPGRARARVNFGKPS